MTFKIICASHDDEVLKKNLLASQFAQRNPTFIMKGYTNVAEAYNAAPLSCNPDEYNVYLHHDVFMAHDFSTRIVNLITRMNLIDPDWGVLGPAGSKLDNGVRRFPGYLCDRGRQFGKPQGLPEIVQTLDELMLITKGDFTFDEQFDLHFYGADICMQACAQGRRNYAISAYVYHNSKLIMGQRTQSFRDCEVKFKEKWENLLPISTTCSLIR